MNQRSPEERLPADEEPAKSAQAPPAGNSNIVHYERRSARGIEFSHAPVNSEVIFIDEQTPTPALPQRQPYVPAGRRRPDDDDVLYIGPE